MTRTALSKRQPIVYDPVGRCIYCGDASEADSLTREHIIPIGMGNGFILPKSSCEPCRRITHEFETICLRQMFFNYRLRLGLVTHRKDIEARIPLAIEFNPTGEIPHLPISEHPPAFLIPALNESPGIFRGGVPNDPISITYQLFGDQDELNKLLHQHIGQLIQIRAKFNDYAFFRMLAKIAHSFIVGAFGIDNFDPELPDFILGKNPGLVSFLIGTSTYKVPVSSPQILHQMDFSVRNFNNRPFIVVRFCPFAAIGAPAYDIVVGEIIPTMTALRKLGLA